MTTKAWKITQHAKIERMDTQFLPLDSSISGAEPAGCPYTTMQLPI